MWGDVCTCETTNGILVNFKRQLPSVQRKVQMVFQLILNVNYRVYNEKYKRHIDNIKKVIKMKLYMTKLV